MRNNENMQAQDRLLSGGPDCLDEWAEEIPSIPAAGGHLHLEPTDLEQAPPAQPPAEGADARPAGGDRRSETGRVPDPYEDVGDVVLIAGSFIRVGITSSPRSKLPQERMAAEPQGWAEAIAAIADAENDGDVSILPGGEVVFGLASEVADLPPACFGGWSSYTEVSKLPQERMAAEPQGWAEVRGMMEDMEGGGDEVLLIPGGGFVRSGNEGGDQPVSRLPQEKMAAENQGPSLADLEELKRLDPANTERWRPVDSSFLRGWRFQMTPPYPGQSPFVFFAFRNVSEGNGFRIIPIRPNLDGIVSHEKHMFKVRVAAGGERLSVLCGPGGRTAQNLDQVRKHAAKWMAYTSFRLAGVTPGFSQ
ncbi:hypothetical protein [Streptomyces sp. LUP30]|uniref:hypothetical protein n=1 Tax=Streptomyces sp. LUP30 TaxID=1890285 RepID=UPI00159F099F|nr:hypothetical protein [Streptomyces sp. LUP30]